MAPYFHRSVPVVGSVLIAVGVMAGCGSDGASGSTARLGDGGPCDLITPAKLQEIVGHTYVKGESEGSQCFFAAQETLGSPMVTVSSGIVVTELPGNAAGNTEVSDTEVEGVAARQMMSKPRGDSCTVEVALVPDDSTQTFSAAVSGVTEGDSCGLAKKIASRILEELLE